MLNVNAYLPSCEQYNSIVDTVGTDVTDIGELANQAGIPEQMIVMADATEQSNESDDVVEDNLQEQNEHTEAVAESEDDGSAEAQDFNVGDTSEGAEEPKEQEENPDEEEEEKVTGVNYAVESYTSLLQNAGDNLSHQSVGFLLVGLTRLQKNTVVETVSTESFEDGPAATRFMANTQSFLTILANIKNHRNHVE